MFGTLAFVTVWQQHDESIVLPPLVFGGHQILVNDDLCSVNEVTKLCFPQNQCFRIGMGISVFKTKRGIFAEQRVVHPELFSTWQLRQRNPDSFGVVIN